ncbi:DNA translocase FtsK [Anaerococcus sp.]|uniref:DNA translocase FtsK n=1 Tax=Anaerococcus sp. TaxID=1872515 RepID=UPI002900E8DF|nr:DNA translocase FtsK [Anaerococcus sp.]MDU1829174.1 DNA translocase FtsK [Anaerococcus sp.]MDU1864642.1 DNA translocase FtsK [Anaerococcus sp.]
MVNSKNDDRIRKKSTSKAYKNKKFKNKKREWNFNPNIFSVVMMVLSIFMFIFIISSNTGKLGNVITKSFENTFGKLGMALPIIIFISFFFAYRDKYKENIKDFLLLYLLFLVSLAFMSKNFYRNDLDWTIENSVQRSATSGGLVGGFLSYYIISFIGSLGLNILFVISIFLFVVGISPLTYREFLQKVRNFLILIKNKLIDLFSSINDKRNEKKIVKNEEKLEKIEQKPVSKTAEKTNKESPIVEKESIKKDIKDQAIKESASRKPIRAYDFAKEDEVEVRSYKSKQIEMKDLNENIKKDFDNYNYPSIDLLEDRSESGSIDEGEIKEKAVSIEETLDSFGIEAKVVQIDVGPTVTCYELKPQRGVKVSKILNLSDDLALSLATSGIRILAPIPGKSHVGIEVPNDSKEIVGFKEIISTKNFANSKSKIPFAMGKSIAGDPVVSGIEKMPHLLVSGATGSGKSVCINTIIMSILYKHSPDDVKLLMIDPKVVELSVYNGIPHLIMPVITDPKKASSSLFWAISEMEKRYKAFQKYHVRDIEGYKKAAQTDESMENLPYIVVIIDELADLMMTAASEVEDYIMRLAQKSRACGIHLVIATQRPTVDVITGTIKANIPSRISFAVTSQTDSRTILDTAGAEKLLGKGDMLYAPSDSMKPLRIQGAFVSDKEVLSVVDYIKQETKVDYDQSAIETVEENSQVKEVDDEDELLDQATQIIIEENTASVSLLQRKLRVGYARAGRIIDQLESKGIVGPYEGSKPRKVLVDRTYLEGE